MSNAITTYRADVAKEAAEAEQARLDAEAALLQLADFVVVEPADNDFAAETARDVKAAWRALEEKRKETVKPLSDEVKTVNGWFKPALEALERVERRLKDEMAGYLRRKENAARAALAFAATTDDHAAATAAIATLTEFVAPPEGVSVSRQWKFRVVDEVLVPAVLCSPDPAKIRDELKRQVAAGLTPSAPGLEFYQEDVVAVRR